MRLLLFALIIASSLFCQVPFVGCKMDGQSDPWEAPKAPRNMQLLAGNRTDGLAYYQAAVGIGVLAPLGWGCHGIYGSSGHILFVAPKPMDKWLAAFPRAKPTDPMIAVLFATSETSGRFQVAEIAGRIFRGYRRYVEGVREGFEGFPDWSAEGPFPADHLSRKSKTAVEYQTPANAEGLGTYVGLGKSEIPIRGAAVIAGKRPHLDLFLLAVKLPANLKTLGAAVIRQFESDAARCPCY